MLFCNFIYFLLAYNTVSNVGLQGILTPALNWHSLMTEVSCGTAPLAALEFQQSVSYLSNHHFYLVHSSLFKISKSNFNMCLL